jgi:hypothetical protein
LVLGRCGFCDSRTAEGGCSTLHEATKRPYSSHKVSSA